jgi:hypothetical protein
MGETADQTRDEIVRLRAEMSAKVIELRRATQQPIRIAKTVAVGAVAVVVVGSVVMVVMSARRRAERRSMKRRLKAISEAAAHPQKAVGQVKAGAEKKVEQSKAKLRQELREELKKELKDQRPLHERVITGALSATASAAVPIILKKLEERTGLSGTSNGVAGKTMGSRRV